MNGAISLSKGWMMFLSALIKTRFWSVDDVAEMMFHLNVTARNMRRHPITDEIYELKNGLVKYLYQQGYCVEVKLHSQKRICHSCGGDGIYWNGEECYKCDGTGVYAVTQLYAFRFDVHGKRYSWHQLKKLVDYPIELTHAEPGAFVEPTPKEDLSLKLDEAWLGCSMVYWFLRLHGIRSNLLLFSRTRNHIRWALRIDQLQGFFKHVAAGIALKTTRAGEQTKLIMPDEDDLPF